MTKNRFELNEQTLSVIEEIGGHMPGGLFIYQAAAPEKLIYANKVVFSIYGCKDLEESKTVLSAGWMTTAIIRKQVRMAAYTWSSFLTSQRRFFLRKNIRKTWTV